MGSAARRSGDVGSSTEREWSPVASFATCTHGGHTQSAQGKMGVGVGRAN